MYNKGKFIKRKDKETEEAFLWRLGQAKDNMDIEISWNEIADIMNKEFRKSSEHRGASSYRKCYQSAKKFFVAGVFCQTNGDDCDNDYLKKVKKAQRNLEIAKVQYRDERQAWANQNRIAGRVEQRLDKLEEELKKVGRINFKKRKSISVDSDDDLLVMLSDLHIGQCFSSNSNSYNSTIAKERLNQLINDIKEIQDLHKCKRCFISLQGDLISGNIHKTVQITNRENVIEQIKLATELIANFCYELIPMFEKVTLANVCGNHSRIDKKEEALKDERLDDLVSWATKLFLKDTKNFTVLDSTDTTLSIMEIRGEKYILVHGDYDKFDKNGVSRLCTYLGFIPYAILFGHDHTNAYGDFQGIKMIRGGSLAGTGDDYTTQYRFKGNASQMVCVCRNGKVKALYPIEFS